VKQSVSLFLTRLSALSTLIKLQFEVCKKLSKIFLSYYCVKDYSFLYLNCWYFGTLCIEDTLCIHARLVGESVRIVSFALAKNAPYRKTILIGLYTFSYAHVLNCESRKRWNKSSREQHRAGSNATRLAAFHFVQRDVPCQSWNRRFLCHRERFSSLYNKSLRFPSRTTAVLLLQPGKWPRPNRRRTPNQIPS